MKKYFRLLIYLLSIISVVFAIDRLVGAAVQKYLVPQNSDKYLYAYNGGGGEDMVIFGASRAAHHYVPYVIYDSLGMTCFNYGCDGQNIYNQYAILNLLLNHTTKKPKFVILELAYIDVLDTPGWNEEKLSALHPYYHLDDTVKQVVSLQGTTAKSVVEVSRLYAYNSVLETMVRPLFGSINGTMLNNGYVPIYAKWDKPIENKYTEKQEVSDLKIDYLERFIERCQRDSIDVLLLNSPHYIKFLDESKWTTEVIKVAQKRGVQFFDFEQNDYYLEHPELFNEPFHLNDNGAQHYTDVIIPIVREILSK